MWTGGSLAGAREIVNSPSRPTEDGPETGCMSLTSLPDCPASTRAAGCVGMRRPPREGAGRGEVVEERGAASGGAGAPGSGRGGAGGGTGPVDGRTALPGALLPRSRRREGRASGSAGRALGDRRLYSTGSISLMIIPGTGSREVDGGNRGRYRSVHGQRSRRAARTRPRSNGRPCVPCPAGFRPGPAKPSGLPRRHRPHASTVRDMTHPGIRPPGNDRAGSRGLPEGAP